MRIKCELNVLFTPQIMKEWAEADNQSKNLPKTERQALNEVCFC